MEECEEVVEEPKTKNIPETGLPSVGKAEKLTNRESQDVRKDMRMMNEDVIKDECVKDCAWGVKGWCKTHSAYGKKKCVTSKKWTKKPNGTFGWKYFKKTTYSCMRRNWGFQHISIVWDYNH